MQDETSLSRLHDIVVPPEVGLWPLAPGWWALLGTAALVALPVGRARWRRWRAAAYRRAALRELATAADVGSISAILRRCALVVTARSTVAAQSGEAWVAWLQSFSATDPMSAEVRALLAMGAYDERAQPAMLAPLRAYAERWIRNHRAP